MPVLETNTLTLADAAKRVDPDGSAAYVAELLNQRNEVTTDCLWMQGNLTTGHRLTVRTGLPQVFWRLLGRGVPISKSHTAQIDETCGMLEGYSRVEKKLLQLHGDAGAAFRASEDRAYAESMAQAFTETLFYGTAATPEQFIGLSARYSSLTAPNGQNIINAGGAANLTSVWLVAWGEGQVFGIYPKNTEAGISFEDLGQQTVYDAENNPYEAYVSRVGWDVGIALHDWRFVVRIANINVQNLVTETSAANLIKLMSRAIDRLPAYSGNLAFYCNRTVASMLRIQALNNSTNAVTVEPALNQFGKTIRELRFLQVPVRIVDRLRSNEQAVA